MNSFTGLCPFAMSTQPIQKENLNPQQVVDHGVQKRVLAQSSATLGSSTGPNGILPPGAPQNAASTRSVLSSLNVVPNAPTNMLVRVR